MLQPNDFLKNRKYVQVRPDYVGHFEKIQNTKIKIASKANM